MTEPEKKSAPRPRRRAAGKVVGFPPAGGGRPKVAVTGGSGYLGARFVRALAARGTWDVVVLDLAPAANTPSEVRHRVLDLSSVAVTPAFFSSRMKSGSGLNSR